MPESKLRSRKMRWVILALVLAAVVVTLYIRATLPARELRAVIDAYRTLEIGATRESLAAHFPPNPDLICTFTGSRILYYNADPRSHYIPGFGDKQKQRIAEVKQHGTVPTNELPFLYGYVQILVDLETNTVSAKSWLGEDADLHTVQGDFRYSGLNELPEDIRTALSLAPGEIGSVE